jgi:hypothetical protein
MLGRAADMVPVGRIDDGFVRTLGPRNPGQQIVVMDSDGEDLPSTIHALLKNLD